MDNYKIKVKDEAESKEAQELFVQLGYKLFETKRIGIVATEDDGTIYPDVIGNWDVYEGQELTLPQLLDLVVLKRNDVKDATHQDKYDASLKYVFLNGEWYEWINGWMAGCINPAKLMPIDHPQDPALIIGAEAYDLIGKRVEVEALCLQEDGTFKWQDAKHLPACDILNDGFDFRLKPQTIKVELELPKPFEPEYGERYWYLDTSMERGYHFVECFEDDDVWCQFGAYHTEAEVKQVVEQLRKIRGAS